MFYDPCFVFNDIVGYLMPQIGGNLHTTSPKMLN
jgi:hypothetical protein